MKYICCCAPGCPPDPCCICCSPTKTCCPPEPCCTIPPCIKHKQNLCDQLKKLKKSSSVLENILDLANVLTGIMSACCINECKAKLALDPIIYSFLNYDEFCDRPGRARKKLRKHEFICDLKQKCKMTKCEIPMAYSIVKYAFKAFYNTVDLNAEECACFAECQWREAAQKTIAVYSCKCPTTPFELKIVGKKITCSYVDFLNRMKCRQTMKDASNPCTCGEPGGPPCPDPCGDEAADVCDEEPKEEECAPEPEKCEEAKPCDCSQFDFTKLDFNDANDPCVAAILAALKAFMSKNDITITLKLSDNSTKFQVDMNGISVDFAEINTMTLVNDKQTLEFSRLLNLITNNEAK